MGKEDFQAWLLIRDVDFKAWYRTAGPSIAALFGGKPVDDMFVSGVMMTFPKVSSAVRTALRCFSEVRRALPGGIMPPMAIDIMKDSKRITAVLHSVKSEFIIVTDDAARLLVGEPIEFLPGPLVPLDGGESITTQMIPISSHNMGWALPTVALGRPSESPTPTKPDLAQPYLRRTEPAVINIHMGKERGLPKIPWKFLILAGVLLFGFAITVSAIRELKSRSRTTNSTEATAETASSATDESILKQIDLSPKATETPPPLGFGTIVIQTEPKDAQVYLNDQLVGKKSPVVLPKRSNQVTYKLLVKKKGFEPYTNIFNVEANERKSIEVRLAKTVPKTW